MHALQRKPPQHTVLHAGGSPQRPHAIASTPKGGGSESTSNGVAPGPWRRSVRSFLPSSRMHTPETASNATQRARGTPLHRIQAPTSPWPRGWMPALAMESSAGTAVGPDATILERCATRSSSARRSSTWLGLGLGVAAENAQQPTSTRVLGALLARPKLAHACCWPESPRPVG